MLNEEWQKVILGEVATLQRGYDLPSRQRRPGLVPIVTSSGPSDTHNESRVTGPGVVTGRYGTIGEVFFITEDFWPLNTTLFVKDFHGNDPLFVSYLLRTIDFRSHSGKSGVPGVNRNDLHELTVALPPLPQQRAIAEALADADVLLGSLTQLIAKKRDLKQAAMQQLLTGKTRLSGFEKKGVHKTEVGEIPEEWEVVHISDLVSTGPRNGYSGRSGKDARGTPTLMLTATTSGRLVLNDETVKRLNETIDSRSDLFLRSGDVLVQRSNTLELVGTTALFNGPSRAYIYPDLMMRMRFKNDAIAHWFWRFANSTDGRRFFVSIAAGSTGSMPKISGEKLRTMPLPLPPLPELREIVEVMEDVDAELDVLEKRLAKARALKQGMIQELLTGRTRLV
jgi:type I restriction enzyme, S subunit